MKVSVVFPTLNEEETIQICIEKAQNVLKSYHFPYEIIVSDSSTDETARIAEGLGAVLVYPENRGYGNAYLKGLKVSHGDILVMADADNTYDLMELPQFLDLLVSGEADFVIGNRFTHNMEKGALPWYRKYMGNPALTLLLNVLFGTRIKDAHCGMRAFTRTAYETMDLSCGGMEFASEMIVEAKRLNLRIKEVPISYYKRENSPSKLNSLRDGWRHLKFLIQRRAAR
jgi:glycosyltransferase involved in cell wall biosynthesis